MSCNTRFWLGLASAATLFGCQSYPFELRTAKRENVQKISQVVLTVRPTDILFVIDNSGSMEEERALVRQNVQQFLDGLTQSATDFQVGLITTDTDCNLPTYSTLPGGSSASCAATRQGATPCLDDLTADYTDCDGGRLRSASGKDRIFARPTAAGAAAWVANFSDAIASLDCNILSSPRKAQGSAYEAGLEAAVRAVSCSVGDASCPDPAVATLNAGFIRPDADLVVIFITDEDDCSSDNLDIYKTAPSGQAGTTAYQSTHFCSPDECYSYDFPGGFPSSYHFLCEGVTRTAPPPALASTAAYLDKLVALKGGDVRRVRAAAIVGGVPDTRDSLAGFGNGACYTNAGVPSLHVLRIDLVARATWRAGLSAGFGQRLHLRARAGQHRRLYGAAGGTLHGFLARPGPAPSRRGCQC